MSAIRRVGSSRALSALVVSGFASGAGLLVAVAVARTSTVDEMGRFGIAAAAVLLIAAIARSAVTDPLIADAAHHPTDTLRIGRASLMGIIGGLGVIGVGLLLGSEFLVIGGLAAHGFVVRECARAVLVACGRVRLAVGAEGIWFAISALALAGALAGVWNGITAFAVWAATGAVLGYGLAHVTHSDIVPNWSRTPVGNGRTIAFATDTVIGSGVVQLVTWAATAVGGLSVAAALRGAGTLAGPVTVGLSAARSVLIPRTVRSLSGARPVRAMARDTTVMSSIALPALVVLAFAPPDIGHALLGDTWTLVAPILPLTAVELLFQLIASVPEAAHRALGAGRRILALRGLSAGLRVPVVLAVAPMGVGAVVAAAACVTIISAVAWWWSLVAVSSAARSSALHNEPVSC